MEDFKIKYTTKYILRWFWIGILCIIVGILPMKFLEDSMVIVPLLVVTPIGIYSLLLVLRIILHGKVFAKITESKIKFSKGEDVPLEDVLRITSDGKGNLFVETKGGYRILLVSTEWSERSLEEVQQVVTQHCQRKRNVVSTYDQDITLICKQVKGCYENWILGLPIVEIIFFYFLEGMIERKVFISIIIIAIIVTAIFILVLKIKGREEITVATITNDHILLGEGEIIPLGDVEGVVILTKYKYFRKKYYANDPGLLTRNVTRAAIEEKLCANLKDGREIKLCSSKGFNYKPQEVNRIMRYKLERLKNI